MSKKVFANFSLSSKQSNILNCQPVDTYNTNADVTPAYTHYVPTFGSPIKKKKKQDFSFDS
jgi:hypothetical protein